MNYELCKRLKDAGFPQGNAQWIYPDGATAGIPAEPDTTGVAVYVPTLSELIEACGSDLIQLRQYADNEWNAMAGSWLDRKPIHFCDVTASTPEEAVAMLWLSLNEK